MRSSKPMYANASEAQSSDPPPEAIADPDTTKIDWRIFIDERVLATLRRVWQLQQYAMQNGYEAAQLAIPYSDFVQWGHDLTQLRVLIAEGILIHFAEMPMPRNGERKLEPRNTLAISSRSCFLLSHVWQSRLGSCTTDNRECRPTSLRVAGKHKPTWDLRLRKLTFQDRLIKHFRCPAQNQEAILCAFEEEGWPERICDPLPPIEACESKQRLHDAIRGLNRNQVNPMLRFGGDGTGEGVVWLVEAPNPRLPTELHHADT